MYVLWPASLQAYLKTEGYFEHGEKYLSFVRESEPIVEM